MPDHTKVTEDICLVRKQLDTLSNTRLQVPLDPELEIVYQQLCARERELLNVTQAIGAN
jgi:hypothetical protein